MKKAFLTGVNGMDGSHLAEFLLGKDYEVYGLVRRSSSPNLSRITHLLDKIHLFYGDVTDSSSIRKVIEEVQPDETYHLAAQSDVSVSFKAPLYTADVDALGTLRLLEAIKECSKSKFYQASTSELFGSSPAPQNESTPFHPRSIYGVAKQFAYWATVNYREQGMFACNGILFNHTGARRGEDFVCRKITKAAARIKMGLQDKLFLGNLESKRDFGWAVDYVRGMWMIMQHSVPDDFVLATGETYKISEFLDVAFEYLDLDWHKYVEIDPVLFRPTEVDVLWGDFSKAKKVLNWSPSITFSQLIKLMVDSERF